MQGLVGVASAGFGGRGPRRVWWASPPSHMMIHFCLYLPETLIGRYTAELDSPLHFAR